MAVTSGFFNSVNHDRLYDAEQLSSIFDGIIIDGVYENYGDAFNVTAVTTTDNMVSVGTGRAWFDHTWTLNDTPLSIAIEPASEMVTRIDAIVLDIDRRKDVRKNSIIYVKGAISEGEPPEPTLVDEEFHKQYPICYIRRPPGVTGSVSQSEIENKVGSEECPVITGILEAQNLSNLFQQLDAEFKEWWDGIRDLIGSEDPVLDLQVQIDELKAYVEGKLEGDNALNGLLEKAVVDLFKTGSYNLNYGSFKIPTTLSFSQIPGDTSGTKAITDSFIMQNGMVFVSYALVMGSDDSVNLPTVIYSSDGVKVTENVQTFNRNYTGAHDAVRKIVLNGKSLVLDESPAKYYIPVIEASGNNNDKFIFGGRVISYTISTDGIISATVGNASYTDRSTSTSTDTSPAFYENVTSTVSGADICMLSCVNGTVSNNINDGPACVFKIDASGVLAIPKMYERTNSPFFCTTKNNWGNTARIYGGEGKAYYIRIIQMSGHPDEIDLSEYVEINETTLDATYHSGSPTIDTSEKNNYEVSAYSLSESNGVSISTREVGALTSASAVTSKYRDYFTGATNADGGIPEGTYMAFENEDNGVLVGIGPNQSQIAIGTNGGAAILKAKASSVGSLDIAQVDTFRVGYVNNKNGVYYKVDTSDTNVTIYKLEKE